jgi:hypothetical protein
MRSNAKERLSTVSVDKAKSSFNFAVLGDCTKVLVCLLPRCRNRVGYSVRGYIEWSAVVLLILITNYNLSIHVSEPFSRLHSNL